jgi:hypothetical protein
MNKITELVAEYLKDTEYIHFLEGNYQPNKNDLYKSWRHLVEDDGLVYDIAIAYEDQIDWNAVENAWREYNQ